MTGFVFRNLTARFEAACLGTLRAIVIFAAVLHICPAIYAQSATELYSQAQKAQKLYDQGDPYRANPLFARAEQQFHEMGDQRHELAAKLGRLHADADHGKYKAVKAEIERDLTSPLVQNDPQLKIQALSLLGIIDLNIDTAAAASDWKQLLEAATATGDLKWENRARGELGIVAGLKGDVGTAGMTLLNAIATAEQIGDVGGAINFLVWLANGMSVNGMADGAVKRLDQATELASRHGYHQMPFQLSIARIRAIARLPEAERSKRIDDAKNLLSSNLRLAEDEKVYGAEIELLNQEGQLELQSGDASGAEQAFIRAASVARTAELPGLEAEAELHLVSVYLKMQQPQKAITRIRQAMEEVHGADEGYDLPLFVAAQADAEAALGHIRTADGLYERATTLLEGLLVNAPSSQVKSSMVNSFSRIYVAHFRLVWEQQHDPVRAFQIIESARGRVLLDSLRSPSRSPTSASLSPAEIRIAQLQRTLIDRRLTTAQEKQILDQLDDAYDHLSISEFDQTRREMAILRHPPLSLPGLVRLLGPHQVFVEYILDDNTSYALEVSSVGMQVHQLPASGQIAKLTNAYLKAAKTRGDKGPEARALYSALISPITAHGWDSLILVPDGSLHLLPFGALQDERGSYLAQRATVSIAPSAAVLAALRREPEIHTAKLFLGVAFNQVGADTAAFAKSRGLANIRGADIRPLQFSHEEVSEATAALGNGTILEGPVASESALKSEPLDQFRIIHLAAHGVGDELEPDRAAIVLNPGSSEEDGLWQAREIRHTRLNADTVVLSACETGTGRLQGEEGIMNLARAFLTAGAKSVVASLWDVDDRSTATLMENFYQHLAQGQSVALALRSSQMEFVKTYGEKADPYLWAGFEVIGDGARTIVTTTKQAELQTTRAHLR
jgi:CHAT domain-containing protein/outer membrane protein assembly factor BamD (BamD/ComL family)